jgi:NADH dehydrogenase|tara:strand:- start:1847 stop:3136 length:1290 start_codon:yes stop_codon:yes gene_type:complete
MNIPRIDLPRIVVLGCGFAGIKFIQKIDSNKYQIVLLDKHNYHTFQPLMYQVATSGLEPDSITYPIRKIFKGKKRFHFRKTEVLTVDHDNKVVNTTIGAVQYDHLVVALGAANNFFNNKQFEQMTTPMKSLTQSLDLRSMILQNFEDALNLTDIEEQNRLMNFVIVGAGATGVELAGALSELKDHVLPKDYPDLDVRRMQIHLVEGSARVLSAMSENASEKSAKFLKEMGVNIWLETLVESYDGQSVVTNNGVFESRSVIWSAGVKAITIEGIDLEGSKSGRVPVDVFNETLNQKDVYALGDIAEMIDEKHPRGHPMLASVAGQQGDWLAKNLNKKPKSKKMKPFVYKDQGTMATIGRNRAVVDLKRFHFSGYIAWLIWMFVHLMLLVEYRNRLIVFANWTWRYIKYDRGSRLIIREYNRKQEKEKVQE